MASQLEKLHCFEKNKWMQKPLFPTQPCLRGLARPSQQRISNILEFTLGDKSTKRYHLAQPAFQEPQGDGL